jgi:putative inorganic carbon (hco3(-)) transporter
MRDLVLMMVFGVVLIPTFVLPHIGVLVWAWIAIMNPHRESFGFTLGFQFNMIIAALTLAAWLFSSERKRLPLNPVTILLVLFSFWMVVTTYTGVNTSYSYEIMDRNLKTMLLVYAILALINTKTRIHALALILGLSLAYWAVRGGLFMVAIGGTTSRVWGPAGSMISDNNHLAAAMLMVFPLINYLRLHSENRYLRIGLAAALALTLLAVLGTYSRGAFVGLAAILPLFWWRSKKKALSLIVLSGLAIGALAAMPDKFFDRMSTIKTAEQDGSFASRLDAWQTAINIAAQRPLTGVGFRAYEIRDVYVRFNPGTPRTAHGLAMHSIYFQVLADQGYPGLLLFLAIGFFSWRNARYVVRAARGRPELAWASDLASMITISLVAYFVAGAALSLAYYDFYYCLVAILVVLREEVARQTAPEAQPSRFGAPTPAAARTA